MGASSGKESIQREIESELQHIESIKREIESYKTQLAREKGRKDVNLNSIKNIIESKRHRSSEPRIILKGCGNGRRMPDQ